MPRNMSFSLTTEQVRAGTKTVTRRTGWAHLKPGDIVNAVEKAMGLKKGEKVVVIRQIRIESNCREPLHRLIADPAYGHIECEKEGFPEMTPFQFVDFFLGTHSGLSPSSDEVNRIEFSYL